MGALLAGVITCCWLIAGIAAVVALAVRAAQRRRGQRPPRHRPERARRILGAVALTAVTLPLLLEGWSAWSWSVGGLALVGAGLMAPKLATVSYAHRLAMLPVLACLGAVGFAVYTVWQRLLMLGGGGGVLAFWVATLTVVLFITLFVACVREAATRTLAWCRLGSGKRCPSGCAPSPWCCPSSMGCGGGSACSASCCWPSPSACTSSGRPKAAKDTS
jgi:hypothetical protein